MPRAAINRETGVTAQQEVFACEFAKTGRLSLAYRRAYKADEMSAHSIWVEAGRLINNPAVSLRVDHYRAIATKKLEVSVERIALETARVAFFDIRDLFGEDGRLIPLHELPEDAARALNGVDVEDLFKGSGKNRVLIGEVKKFKHVQKMDALKLLAQWKKMLVNQEDEGKVYEFEGMTDEEVAAEAKQALEIAVKGGFVKVLPLKDRAKAKQKAA